MGKSEVIWFFGSINLRYEKPVCSLCEQTINELYPVIVRDEIYGAEARFHKDCYWDNKESLNLVYDNDSRIAQKQTLF